MRDEDIEKAFDEAQRRWIEANPNVGYSTTQHRYFFFAGGAFGVEQAGKAQSEIVKEFRESVSSAVATLTK